VRIVVTTIDEALDPRVRRTRSALYLALGALISRKDFEKISVGDIAEEAGLNRATFYDHYSDKFALLEAMVGDRFHELMRERGVTFDGGCASAFKAIILGVCDYVASTARLECERQQQMEPHVESAVIAIVRKMLLHGIQQSPTGTAVPAEMIATTASWAIYGAAKEWVHTPNRPPSESALDMILALVVPILTPTVAADGG
jgi:AcrR family transcriptional regulator